MHISEVGMKIAESVTIIDQYKGGSSSFFEGKPADPFLKIEKMRNCLLQVQQGINYHQGQPLSTALYTENYWVRPHLVKCLSLLDTQKMLHPELSNMLSNTVKNMLLVVMNNRHVGDKWYEKAITALKLNPIQTDVEAFSAILKEGKQLGFLAIQNNEGETIFHHIAKNEKYLSYLISFKQINFPPDIPDNFGRTPLYLSIHGGNTTMAQAIIFLFGKGSYLNGVSINGSPFAVIPLHKAIFYRNHPFKYKEEECLNVIQALLDAGADVNLPHSITGLTPLHLACRHGDVELVKRFLAAGANPFSICVAGRTPVQELIFKENFEPVQQIKNLLMERIATLTGAPG